MGKGMGKGSIKIAENSGAHILKVLEKLVDDQVGIIRQVQELRKDAGSPDFVYMTAETCNLKALTPLQHHQGAFIGSGTAADRSKAMAKAVGEAVEHYCAANYAIEDFPLTTFESASFPCVGPEEFALFSAAQYNRTNFPYRPFQRTMPMRWVPAFDLTTRNMRYVPAAMVFLPYHQMQLGETPITQQISTGLACHSNPAIAALSAICEVIEREAIAITWQARLPRAQIRPDTLSPHLRTLLARLRRPGTYVALFHLAMDHGIPVIFAMMRDTSSEAPALVVAAASHLDPEQAVQKSLEELAQIRSLNQRFKAEKSTFSAGRKWKHVVDSVAHAAVYYTQINAHFADFLLKSRSRIALSDIPDLSTSDPDRDLHLLIGKIATVKHNVLIVDVTSEDVRSLGLWVFRALIPGFHPLFIGHQVRALGGTRLWEVPQKLGYPGLRRERGDNPVPHPFA